MERKINELPEVELATITFATKQLCVASDHQENILPKLQEICASVESEVVVRPREEEKKVLSGMWLKGGEVIPAVAGIISADDFYRDPQFSGSRESVKIQPRYSIWRIPHVGISNY